MGSKDDSSVYDNLRQGVVIPAHPLALDANRKLDETSQRALTRYYLASGAGGLAVGVHTTQFQIHEPQVGLYRPILELAAEEIDRSDCPGIVRVAGIVGKTDQAIREAGLAQELGYQLGLLSLGAMKGSSEDRILEHCRQVAEVIPLFGFYLQPAAGGIELGYSFWRQFMEIDQLRAIKVAAFNRYQTLDVIRALVDAGRYDVALYTGNDDNIVNDLITPFRFGRLQRESTRFVGGLLGHWAVWTKRACELLGECHAAIEADSPSTELLIRNVEVTDCNAAIFDPANRFAGCIPGVLEVLKRQGLISTSLCLDPNEVLSPGQDAEIERVCRSYPHLIDDEFVRQNLDAWRS